MCPTYSPSIIQWTMIMILDTNHTLFTMSSGTKPTSTYYFETEVGSMMEQLSQRTDQLVKWVSTTIHELELMEKAANLCNNILTFLAQLFAPAPVLLYTRPTCPLTPRTTCPVPSWVIPNSAVINSDTDDSYEYTHYTPRQPRQSTSWFKTVLIIGAVYHAISFYVGPQKWMVLDVDPRKIALKWMRSPRKLHAAMSPRRGRRPATRKSSRISDVESRGYPQRSERYVLSPRRSARLAAKRT